MKITVNECEWRGMRRRIFHAENTEARSTGRQRESVEGFTLICGMDGMGGEWSGFPPPRK